MKVDSKTSLVDNYRDDKVRALKSKELDNGIGKRNTAIQNALILPKEQHYCHSDTE